MIRKLGLVAAGISLLVSSVALGANNFVYTNDNVAGANTVSAYRVADADGALTFVGRYNTGGNGDGGGLFASNRVRARQAQQFLFVTNDGSRSISTFEVNQSTGVLTLSPSAPVLCGSTTGGDLSLALVANKRLLICAATSNRTLTVFSIANSGGLSVSSGPITLPATGRPDAMEVSPDGNLLAVALVDSDRVAMYQIANNGSLTPAPGSPFASPGGGLATGVDWTGNSSRLIVGESNSSNVVVHAFNVAASGALSLASSLTTAGTDSQVVQLSLDDRFVFVTNQGSSSVTTLALAANGSLTRIGQYSVGAGQPAGMGVRDDGKFLYVASYPFYLSVLAIKPDGSLVPAPGSPTNTGRPPGLESLAAYPPPGAAPPDTTAPTTTAAQSPNLAWCSTDVAVTLTATDNAGGSGVKSITYSVNGGAPVTVLGASASFTLTSEGVHTVSFFAVDNAANAETAQLAQVRIDRTAPTISGSPAPGWYNADVLVSFSCVDALAGSKTCSSPVSLTAEGADQSASGTAEDNAGNTASTVVSGIGIDKTPPSISASQLPAAGASGWNNGDVLVSFSCTDALSGVASCSAPVLFGTEGSAQSATGDATDNAGNTASTTAAAVNIDKTAPSITAERSPLGNGFGWNNGPVITTFTCGDALSGIASCTAPVTLASEGAAQEATGTAVDQAQNSATASSGPVNIDLTAPGISGQRSPAANGAGWNNVDVTVSWTCTDALSGVDGCSSPAVVSAEGADQSRSGQASDKAGNAASASVSGISIDKTAPSITGSRAPEGNAFGWNNSPVTVSFTCHDGLSGIADCSSPSVVATEGLGLTVAGQALDRAGNGGSTSVTGMNLDFTPPSLTLPSALTIEATGPSGATVGYASSASDALSGMLDFNCAPASGAVFALGTSSVQCAAYDKAGNQATGSFTVTVQDTTAPVVTPPADVTRYATSAAGALVSYPAASATDLVSGVLPATCSPSSGSLFGLGTTTVTCSATDGAGNTGSATFKVTVTFQTGVPFFLQPLNNDGSSVFKLGSTVPVKFQLAGVSAGITNLSARILIAKVSNGIVGSELEATSTSAATTGNLFRYSADGNLYMFNLGTKGLSAGTWQIRADLGDGVLHMVNVSLRN